MIGIRAIVNRIKLRRITLALQSLPKKLQRKIIREEARKAGKAVLLPQAKKNTPKRSGDLRRAVRLRAIKKSRRFVGVRIALSTLWFKGDTFYGGFIEYGWRMGKRSRALVAAQRRRSRAKNNPLYGISKKTGKLRKRAEAAMKAARAALANDKRRHVPGRYFLKHASKTHGPKAADVAAKAIGVRVDQELAKI